MKKGVGSGAGYGSGSGSISQKYGSGDPDQDPHKKSHGSPTLLPRISPPPPPDELGGRKKTCFSWHKNLDTSWLRPPWRVGKIQFSLPKDPPPLFILLYILDSICKCERQTVTSCFFMSACLLHYPVSNDWNTADPYLIWFNSAAI
jgi:hypothetical protein